MTLRSIAIDVRNASNVSIGMSQRWIVSMTARLTSSSLCPAVTSARKPSAHRLSLGARRRLRSGPSTISSAVLAKAYRACTYGRFAGGSRSVAR